MGGRQRPHDAVQSKAFTRRVRATGCLGTLILLAGITLFGFKVVLPNVTAASATSNLHVSGSALLNGANNPVFLHGVDYSGGEYACIQGWGIFDGPSDQTFVNGLLSAHVNAVRVPMNEDCWLGINGVAAAYGGANYQNAIVSFANLLVANGITPILSLVWAAPGSQKATDQPVMPDADHSTAFWAGVAEQFAGRTDVILGLYGEPHPSSWSVWQNGGVDDGYQTVGMQSLVDTVRAKGFHGVLSLPGIDWANTLGGSSGWLAYKPNDPDKNLMAEVHVYMGNVHQTPADWTVDFGPTAKAVPLFAGEMGAYCYDDSCSDPKFATTLWSWLASVGADGAMAWTWNTWGDVESLVSDFNGPMLTAWGKQVKAQYATYGNGSGGPPPPTPPPTATSASATTTTIPSTPPPSPPPSGSLALVQSASEFIDYAGVNESYAKFNAPVSAQHLLVAVVAIAGGNPYVVDHIEDDLHNTWHKAVTGVNGDNTDVEIWYANSAASGADEVDAYLKALPGATSDFVQSYVTVAEFNGTGAFHAGHSAESSLTGTHDSGTFASATGDLVVGGYADAGYVGTLKISDGKSLLGSQFAGIDAIQGIQSYAQGTDVSSSVTYSNNHFARAEVAGASFTPTSGSGGDGPVQVANAPCTVTINGGPVTGTCTGSITVTP
jgi:endoglucanase